jgi:hypothetical protein
MRKLQDQIPNLLALIALPDELAALVARLAELDSQTVGPVEVPAAATLVARGMDLDKAQKQAAQAAAEAERAVDGRKILDDAREVTRRRIKKWTDQNTSMLIEQPIRAKMSELLEAAAPHAEVLRRFGPRFDLKLMGRTATPDETAAWQNSRPLADDYITLLDGWMRLWRAQSYRPHPSRPLPEYVPTRAAGAHAWADTSGLADDLLFGHTTREVLNVAGHRDRFRLASPREWMALTKKHPPTRAYWKGRRTRVWISKTAVRDPDVGEVRVPR